MDGGFKKKSLYLSGKTGTGKTAMMNTLLSEKYGKEAVLRINNIQGLKKLNDKPYKALLMDDVDLTGLTGEDLISLFDTEHDSEQRVLYGTAEIPGGLPRAVISNKKLESLFKCKELSQIEAILRRCLNLDLGDKKLILRLEIEVTQNKTDSPDSESLNKC